MLRFLLRYLLSLLILGVGVLVAFELWPWQGEAYLALFGHDVVIDSGVAVTGLALLGLLQLHFAMALWRSRRELARLRRALTDLNDFTYAPSSWSRAAR